MSWVKDLPQEAKDDLLEALINKIEGCADVPPFAHNHLLLTWEAVLNLMERFKEAEEDDLLDPETRRGMIQRIK